MSNRLQKYWIPVTRALPKIIDDRPYLVTVLLTVDFGEAVGKSKIIETAYYTDDLSRIDYDFPEKPGWYYKDDYNFYKAEGARDEMVTAEVLAWMPYPNPYEDGEEHVADN